MSSSQVDDDPDAVEVPLGRDGDAASAALDAARAVRADLIVVAARERTWIARLLTSSSTDELVRHAEIPVLVVNTDQVDRPRPGLRP
jgi:nucleotide-binding universal stress UspA family protein